MLTCSKQDTCRNHPHRCWECRAVSDILEYYPLYKHRFKDMSYIDFLSEVEVLAVGNGLRFVMERAPIGCGFLLYFQHNEHSAISEMVSWLYDKQDFEPIYHKLEKIATEFSRQHDYLQFKQATNPTYDDYDDRTTSGLIEEY